MSLEDRYDVFVFDCDGVLWSGDEAIAGAADVIRRLQALGKQIFFVTVLAPLARVIARYSEF